MSCGFWSISTECSGLVPIVQGLTSSGTSTATNAAWDAVCQSFVDAASALLKIFGTWFEKAPGLNLASAGIATPYGIALVIGSTVAALLVFAQVIHTMWTRDGTAMAQALTGTAKAVLAWLMTAAVATAGLAASDQVTQFIVTAAFGSQQGLADKLGSLVNWSGLTAVQPLQGLTGAAFLLVIGTIGLVLVVVLWFELLLRNAALAVLIAVSPIPASGQVSEATKTWWPRTVAATVQLIILKPVLALVFAVGFGMAGQSSGVAAVLQGLLVLGLAAFAWPVIARFFTFTNVQAASAGLSAVLGFAAGTMAGRASGGPAGVQPGQFSQASESRVMGSGGAAAGPGGAGGGARGGGALGAIGFALQKAHQAGSALAGQMEQTAGHAGMPGAYPYSTIGGSRLGPARRVSGSGQGASLPPGAGGSTGAGGGQPQPGGGISESFGSPGGPDDQGWEF